MNPADFFLTPVSIPAWALVGALGAAIGEAYHTRYRRRLLDRAEDDAEDARMRAWQAEGRIEAERKRFDAFATARAAAADERPDLAHYPAAIKALDDAVGLRVEIDAWQRECARLKAERDDVRTRLDDAETLAVDRALHEHNARADEETIASLRRRLEQVEADRDSMLAGRTVGHNERAGEILALLGIPAEPSQEPGADPRRDRLAALLASQDRARPFPGGVTCTDIGVHTERPVEASSLEKSLLGNDVAIEITSLHALPPLAAGGTVHVFMPRSAADRLCDQLVDILGDPLPPDADDEARLAGRSPPGEAGEEPAPASPPDTPGAPDYSRLLDAIRGSTQQPRPLADDEGSGP